jgi:hypothetical protein
VVAVSVFIVSSSFRAGDPRLTIHRSGSKGKRVEDGRILYLDHVVGNGRLLFEQILKMDLEGIVCKRKDSPYKSRISVVLLVQGEEPALQPTGRARRVVRTPIMPQKYRYAVMRQLWREDKISPNKTRRRDLEYGWRSNVCCLLKHYGLAQQRLPTSQSRPYVEVYLIGRKNDS